MHNGIVQSQGVRSYLVFLPLEGVSQDKRGSPGSLVWTFGQGASLQPLITTIKETFFLHENERRPGYRRKPLNIPRSARTRCHLSAFVTQCDAASGMA